MRVFSDRLIRFVYGYNKIPVYFDVLGRLKQAILTTIPTQEEGGDPAFIGATRIVLSEGFFVGSVAVHMFNATSATILLFRHDASRNAIVKSDTDPTKKPLSGVLKSLLYEKDGNIFFHEFEEDIRVATLERKRRSIGLLSTPARYDPERGFLK